MDYRKRKYYYVRFTPECCEFRMSLLKTRDDDGSSMVKGLKFNSPFGFENSCYKANFASKIGFMPTMLIGCHEDSANTLEYELNKSVRNDGSRFCECTKELRGE